MTLHMPTNHPFIIPPNILIFVTEYRSPCTWTIVLRPELKSTIINLHYLKKIIIRSSQPPSIMTELPHAVTHVLFFFYISNLFRVIFNLICLKIYFDIQLLINTIN